MVLSLHLRVRVPLGSVGFFIDLILLGTVYLLGVKVADA